jgi:hypothetical protein
MHYRKQPHKLKRAYAFAAAARAEGAELLYFSPGAVGTGGIDGYFYRGGEWKRERSRYPDAVYNASAGTEKRRGGIDLLSRAGIPFTSHSVGDKMTVYRNLMAYGRYDAHLVPSEVIRSEGHFLSLLDKHKDMIVKPLSGHQGKGVHRVLHGSVSETLLKLFSEKDYLAQPYINCRTKAGDPYDLRLHTQKGHRGAWTVPSVYPRISPDGGVVCNLSGTGHTRVLDDFLKEQFDEKWFDTKKYLEVFALQFSEHMDQIQRELYGEELDELGIDAGFGPGGRLYIYEVNWRPGYPPFYSIDLTVVKNSVNYAMHLAGRRRISS